MTYQYLAADTVTGRILGDLELNDLTWERGLLTTGGVQATLSFTGTEDPHALRDLVTPYRSGVIVLRDGRVVCDAIWQPRRPGDEGSSVDLNGLRTWTMFDHRHVAEPKEFHDTDEADIVRWLLEHGTARPGGGLNLTINCPPTGVLRDASFEIGDVISDEISALAEGSFEFDLTCSVGRTHVTREFQLHHPAQGGENPEIVFRASGNLTNWGLDENIVENVVTVVGGEGTVPETFINDEMLGFGWPRIESRTVAKDLTEQGDVAALAEARMVLLSTLKTTPSIEVAVYAGWQPGEIVPVQVDPNPFHPDGYATWARIATTRVAVTDEEDEHVTVRFGDRLSALPPTSSKAAARQERDAFDRRLRNLE